MTFRWEAYDDAPFVEGGRSYVVEVFAEEGCPDTCPSELLDSTTTSETTLARSAAQLGNPPVGAGFDWRVQVLDGTGSAVNAWAYNGFTYRPFEAPVMEGPGVPVGLSLPGSQAVDVNLDWSRYAAPTAPGRGPGTATRPRTPCRWPPTLPSRRCISRAR